MKGAKVLGDVRAIHYEMELPIDASPERTWEAFTTEIDAWWPASFHVLGEGSSITLELEPGGRFVETKPDGTSLLWFIVEAIEPGRSLSTAGHLHHAWGGPATTLVQFTIEPREGGCVMKVADSLFGHVTDRTLESLQAGWNELLGTALADHLRGVQ